MTALAVAPSRTRRGWCGRTEQEPFPSLGWLWLDVAAFAALAGVTGPEPMPPDRAAYGELDLASTTDLTAFVLVAPRDIAAGLVHHDGNPVLRWMVANAVASEDAAGNIKPDREKSGEKIYGVAAWLDALFALTSAPSEEPLVEPFVMFR